MVVDDPIEFEDPDVFDGPIQNDLQRYTAVLRNLDLLT